MFNFLGSVRDFNSANCDVFARRHFVAHEVLKDDSDLRMQIGQIVFAEVDAIEQNLTFGWIVETRDQLDDGGFPLAVLTNQSHAFSRGGV
jgi:hypothetical protein